ncbi:MAG: GAF domain-containing protein, partial [Longimicrobiaceae bacterium]
MTERAVSDAVHDPVRLAALRHTTLLDTPPEESFDRLTRLAARALGAPVALLSLVDEERQFFKSSVGLPEPWASQRETPLSHSFCQHVVASGEPLFVEDAREQPQLHPDLAITELGIVAYAGVPLRTREGQPLGTLCAIDFQPREWKEAEVGMLRDLAAAVMAEIERWMADIETSAVQQWTGSILHGFPDGFATLDRQWRYTFVNPRAEQILGRRRRELIGRSIWDVFAEARDTAFYREFQRAAAEHVSVHFTEFYAPLNLWVDIHAYPSAEGSAIYFRDITERVHAEE